MAEVTRKRTGELLKVVFKILWDFPEGLEAKEILDKVPELIPLTEYESGYFISTPQNQRYEKIIRFATIDLVKAGWLLKSKGYWILTEIGREAFKKYPDPEEFYKEAVRLYHEWIRSRPKIEAVSEEEIEEKEESFIVFEEAEAQAWKQVKNFLQSMNPYEFQQLVADLLIAMDYHISWIAPPGKDRGVDIIAYQDPLGTSAPRIKVQVKLRNQSIPVEDLRAFLSTLGNDDVGIFVSSGGFTSDAKDEARTQAIRKITLLDLEQFYDLWVQFYENLSQDARQRFPLKPIYYLDTEE